MWRRKQQFPRPRKSRLAQMPAGDHFLEAELDGPLQRDGRAHGDHGSRSHNQWTPDRELQCQNRVAVAVGDAVGPAVEGAHVVDRGSGADEVGLTGGTTWHLGRGDVGIQGRFLGDGGPALGRAGVVGEGRVTMGNVGRWGRVSRDCMPYDSRWRGRGRRRRDIVFSS